MASDGAAGEYHGTESVFFEQVATLRLRHCACMPNIRLTTVNSSSFVFRILLRQSESWTTSGE